MSALEFVQLWQAHDGGCVLEGLVCFGEEGQSERSRYGMEVLACSKIVSFRRRKAQRVEMDRCACTPGGFLLGTRRAAEGMD